MYVCDSCMRIKGWSSTGGSRGLQNRCDECGHYGPGYFGIEAQYQEHFDECKAKLEWFASQRSPKDAEGTFEYYELRALDMINLARTQTSATVQERHRLIMEADNFLSQAFRIRLRSPHLTDRSLTYQELCEREDACSKAATWLMHQPPFIDYSAESYTRIMNNFLTASVLYREHSIQKRNTGV